jgi:hypothetical protein
MRRLLKWWDRWWNGLEPGEPHYAYGEYRDLRQLLTVGLLIAVVVALAYLVGRLIS